MQSEIRVIFPSSSCDRSLLQNSIKLIEKLAPPIIYRIPKPHSSLPFLSSSIQNRVSELNTALLDDNNTVIWCARGGYGASDLLPFIPWEKLKKKRPKLLIGFSDVSAIQSALFTKLGWPSLHAPMPGSLLWGKNGKKDLNNVLNIINKSKFSVKISVRPFHKKGPRCGPEVWLFGGCMSVLCSLIGTPYFPNSLRGALLFLEDTGETPGRILRMFNQLLLSGALDKAAGLLFGNFGEGIDLSPLLNEIAQKISLPIYTSKDFGHVSPNMPLMIGAKANIKGNYLHWTYQKDISND